MMRRVLLAVVLLGVLGACWGTNLRSSSGIETIHPQPRQAFRRCWVAGVRETYCAHTYWSGGPATCQNSAERAFVDASYGKVGAERGRARVAWLQEQGCPQSVIFDR